MHQAIVDGRVHQLRLLLIKHKDAIDVQDLYGRSPLIICALLGDQRKGNKMAELLMKASAALNSKDILGRTALFYGVINANEGIVRKILSEDVTCLREEDNEGNTALHHAAITGNPRIVKLLVDILVKFNLPVDHKNEKGYTALLIACKHANFIAAFIIYMFGDASCSVRDSEFYRTPLQWLQGIQSQSLNSAQISHNPYLEITSVHGIAQDGTLILPEGSESFRDLIEPQRAHTILMPFDRENSLARFYRESRIRPQCKHVRHIIDPFVVPATITFLRMSFYFERFFSDFI